MAIPFRQRHSGRHNLTRTSVFARATPDSDVIASWPRPCLPSVARSAKPPVSSSSFANVSAFSVPPGPQQVDSHRQAQARQDGRSCHAACYPPNWLYHLVKGGFRFQSLIRVEPCGRQAGFRIIISFPTVLQAQVCLLCFLPSPFLLCRFSSSLSLSLFLPISPVFYIGLQAREEVHVLSVAPSHQPLRCAVPSCPCSSLPITASYFWGPFRRC